MGEEITAFEFDDELQRFYGSADGAVRFVAMDLWLYYDDCKDHHVVLSRAAWGYFQRLLLLLESEASIETVRNYRWSWTQLVALAALVALTAVVIITGWGHHLWIYAVPFGFVSFLLAIKATQPDATQPYRRVLYPFRSFSDLRTACDRVSFKKQKYPRHLEGRTIRPPRSSGFLHCQFFLGSMIWAPVCLLFQACPQLYVDSKAMLPNNTIGPRNW